jgi:hypothetical protein
MRGFTVNETILVYVNGKRVTIYRGMQVKHALIACDQSLYEDAAEGTIAVEDENGFLIGLEGALCDGAKICTRKAGTS